MQRFNTVKSRGVLVLLSLAMLEGCGQATSRFGSEFDSSIGTGEMSGSGSTATSSSTGGAGGAGGAMGGAGGSGGAIETRELIAILDDTTPLDLSDVGGLNEKDELTVFDPAHPSSPLFAMAGFKECASIGATRVLGSSTNKKRLGVVDMLGDLTTLRVFDENLQPLMLVALPERGSAVCPTENAIFALLSKSSISSGTVVKFQSDGTYVGSTVKPHGVDLVVDEERQVVWTVGPNLMRTTADLLEEKQIYTFPWAAVSLDLDAQGGIWVTERRHPQVSTSVNQLVHFDGNGKIIDSDTVPLPGSPVSVRVGPSGLVWVAMYDAGVAYRNENGELEQVPGLSGSWFSVEPDPLDSSLVWAASLDQGRVVHVKRNGFIVQSFEGFSNSVKWLGVLLQGP